MAKAKNESSEDKKREVDPKNPGKVDGSAPESSKKPVQKMWHEFIEDKSILSDAIITRLRNELVALLTKHQESLKKYAPIYLYDTHFSISSFASERIYTTLLRDNPKHDRDVLLFLTSPGGSIEPAYLISKICKAFAKRKFVVVAARAAKSSATLISLGAHEIHMGLLSELGPIDPQISGRSVLGLNTSLEQMARICEQYPKSSKMFSDYLTTDLYLLNIGHYQRVGKSAVQYAERLISNKPKLKAKAHDIAELLVNKYEDHGFVIDVTEATEILDKAVVKTGTVELKVGEEMHQIIDMVDFWLGYYREECIRIIGDLGTGIFISKRSKK